MHDRIAGRTTLVSRSSSGALGNGNSAYAAFDGASHVLAFASEASNLLAEDSNAQADIFLRRFVDCNGNGVRDMCEIAAGLAYDVDADGVPDDCQVGRPGDLNCDGMVDFFDIDPFVAALLGEETYREDYPDRRWLNADCDQDCDVDFFDIDPFVALFGT